MFYWGVLFLVKLGSRFFKVPACTGPKKLFLVCCVYNEDSENIRKGNRLYCFFEQRPALLYYMVSSLFIWLQVHTVTKTFQKRTFFKPWCHQVGLASLSRLCIDSRATPREQDNEVMLGSSFYRWKWGSWREKSI